MQGREEGMRKKEDIGGAGHAGENAGEITATADSVRS